MENKFADLEHICRLLMDKAVPKLDGDLGENPLTGEIHESLSEIREIIKAFSKGNFSPEIKGGGYLHNCLKLLRDHLNRLTESLADLKHKEKTLLALTNNLRDEVKYSSSAVEALQESEAHFKYLASHDALTGIYNRRTFIEIATAQLNNAGMNRINCCMAILDIDHFKLFNDTYGHIAGDEALRHVVKIVADGLRKGDFLGRYGGEEFILFFYNSNEKRGMSIAERLRAALESVPVHLERQAVTVTASFGIAMAEGHDEGLDEKYIQRLINDADIALYAAKRSGRNKVVLYNPELRDEFDEGLAEEKSEAMRNSISGVKV